MQIDNLQTHRLKLRLLQESDLEDLFGLESDPEVQKFSLTGPKTYEETKQLLNKLVIDPKEKQLPCFLIFDLFSHKFIGRIGFFYWKDEHVEVGYSLHKIFWGKGYATEALTAVLGWAHQYLDVDDIYAYTAINNLPSIHVLKKCGMVFCREEESEGVQGYLYHIKNK